MTDFSMHQGDTKRLEITVLDADGVVVDLSGASSVRWAMARSAKSNAALEKSVGDGVTLVGGGSGGRIDVEIDSADTEDLTPAEYYHETEVVLASGTFTVDDGTITLRRALIKPA